MKKVLMAALGIAGAIVGPFFSSNLNAAEAGMPVIRFETNFFDFGKLSIPGKVAGSFKFRNAGAGTLKVDPPAPSCGCVDAKVNTNTLAPGETGEISYTINLEHTMRGAQKHIRVHSNDPKTPDVQLTMQFDFRLLYEVNPSGLRISLPPGEEEARSSFTVTRTDGKPLQIDRLSISQKSMSVDFDPSLNPQANAARVNVTVRRPPNPAPVTVASVQLWNTNLADRPVQTLMVTSDAQPELSVVPPRVYWVIPGRESSPTNQPAAPFTRTVELKSLTGKPVEVKNATSNIEGLVVKVVPREPGKVFDLVLTFDGWPKVFTNGTVSIETSPGLPKIEVPVTIGLARGK
jgi:hypothetical protein